MVNGPLKNEKSRKFYPSLGISHNLLKGLGISDFVSVGHIFAFLSSHYTFSSRARILKRQSRRVSNLPFATPYIILWLKIDFKGLPVLMYAQFFVKNVCRCTCKHVIFKWYYMYCIKLQCVMLCVMTTCHAHFAIFSF